MFASFNIRSLHDKMHCVLDILADGVDVLALQETWHSTSDDYAVRNSVPPGYSIIDVPRSVDSTIADIRPQRGGGVAIVYRSTLLGRQLILPSIFTSFEYVLVDLSCQAYHLLVISLYRSSSDPLSSKFFDDIKTSLNI